MKLLYGSVILSFVFILLLQGIVSAQFFEHKLTGTYGDSIIEMTWEDSFNLRGHVGTGIMTKQYFWKFSNDFTVIEVTEKIRTMKTIYKLHYDESTRSYRGNRPASFSMGNLVEFNLYSDRIVGREGLDKIIMNISPPIKQGEIQMLDMFLRH